MRNIYLFKSLQYCSVIIFFCLSLSSDLTAQQLKITDFVVFARGSVQFGSSSFINGGSIGSYRHVETSGSIHIKGNIYSGGTVELANKNTITGRITASNSFRSTNNILSVGSGASLDGNIDILGNIKINSGTVSGKVTHPVGTIYSGPTPLGGNIIGNPMLPVLPQMPAIRNFPAAGNTIVNSTTKLTPGAYGKLSLKGKKTITFSGPGIYIFSAINNSGSENEFVFDFKNTSTGDFLIYVHGDVDLDKLDVSMVNGGSPSRIYTEIHGNGSTSYNKREAMICANGSSGGNSTRWLGTVWAPYAGIDIGAGPFKIIGALWSNEEIKISSGATIEYNPYIFCNLPNAKAGPDKQITCDLPTVKLDGSSATALAQFSWSVLNGKGVIMSGANTATPTVSAAGTYLLTVAVPGGCIATDTAVVTNIPCILPFYPPPATGKVGNLIGAELNSLYMNFGTVKDSAKTIFIILSDSVMIEVIAKQGQYQTLLALLQTAAYGMTDLVNNGPNSLIITGKYPIAGLRKLDGLPNLISYCRPLLPAVSNVGITSTQGDGVMRADFLRNGYQLNGDSVKVGVLSDSYNTIPGNPAQTDVDNGDLPGIGNSNYPLPVEVLLDYPFGRRIDEGRAMLQIIHDIAPKATLAFRTGFISAGDFAEGIRELQQNGCDVIVDDVTYITEPFLKDGLVSQAVNDVNALGVTYLSAAGNFSNKSYQAVFNPVAAPNGIAGQAHSFNASGDIFQNISLSPGVYTIVLQWQDGFTSLGEPGPQNDLDIYLTDNNGLTLFGFNRNNILGGSGDPIEILPFTVTANTQSNILIVKASGSGNIPFKYVIFRGDAIINEFNSGSSTIVGQANAEGALTIGAVRYTRTPAYGFSVPEIEAFSSYGGTPVNGIIRNKPDFTAPDGINTSVSFGSPDIDADGIPNFFGTSAAAPHAAAVVALLKQARKRYYGQNYSSAEIRALLQSTAVDMNTPGFDFISGYGFIKADAAIQRFAAATPSLIQLVVPSNITAGTIPFTVTVKGNFLSDKTQILFRGQPVSSTFINDSTITASIPVFNGNPSIQASTPCLTPTCIDGGLSNTITFFAPVKKNIMIVADNKTKRFGEALPLFTSTITIDGVPLANSGLSLSQLGINTINYRTTATSASNVNNYIIQPSLRNFDPANPIDAGLLELYIYDSVAGVLSITKMPLLVTPKDVSVTYGDPLPAIQFRYSYTDVNIPDSERATFLSNIQSGHQSTIAPNAFAYVNGRALVSGRALV
ncbi:MAG: S8 family serine peptidase, partial [Chitinophagaceae bacterium]|nr:S8 family serine peptidase [Chitinophagaceae bacterium]